MKVRNVKIVDGHTGEVEYDHSSEVRMYLFKEEKGFLFAHNRRSVRSFPNIVWPDLTNNELAYLFKLSRHMTEDNRIKGKTAQEMSKIIGLSNRRTYDFLFQMQGLHIIIKANGGYYINPLYFFVGKYLSSELYQLFKEELDPYLSDWAKGKLGE